MKVLHVFKDYYPPTHGGIEHLIQDISHRMPGHEFAVLTSSRSNRTVVDDDQGVPVVRAREFGRIGSAPITFGLTKHIRALGPDLLHFHMPNPTAELAFLASRLGMPAVATYHAEVARAPWLVPPYHYVQRRFLRRMHTVMVGSSAFAGHTPLLRPLRDVLEVVPYGTDPDLWAQRPAAADDIRARYPGPIVLFAGRLVHYKGVRFLIDAMRAVEATLLIVGSGRPQVVDPLREHARQAGLSDRVVFVGGVANDERAAYYHATDVVVLPSTSRSESFGIVLIEAMACGTPVISTEVGSGTSWVNVDGETGFVVAPRDPGALAMGIRSMLADPQRSATMGEAGRRRVVECFTLTRMFDALNRVYNRAASDASRSPALPRTRRSSSGSAVSRRARP